MQILKKKCQKANELFLTKFLRIDEEGKLLRNRNDRDKKWKLAGWSNEDLHKKETSVTH